MDFRCGFAAQINLRSLEYIALPPIGDRRWHGVLRRTRSSEFSSGQLLRQNLPQLPVAGNMCTRDHDGRNSHPGVGSTIFLRGGRMRKSAFVSKRRPNRVFPARTPSSLCTEEGVYNPFQKVGSAKQV